MTLRIVIWNGDLQVSSSLIENNMLVGRDPSCAIILNDPMISRKHARISQKGQQFFMEDLGSINGMLLENRLVRKVDLRPGQRFEIPPYTFEIKNENAAEKDRVQKRSNVEEDDLIDQPKSLEDLLDVPTPPLANQETSEIDPNSDNPTKKSIEMDATEVDLGSPRPLERKMAAKNAKGNATILVPFKTTPRLHPLNINLKEDSLPLEADEQFIGRSKNCQILLPHPSVSKQHAVIRKEGDGYLISDMESTNGTRVNGDLIKECLLQCHDVIEIGDIRLEFLEGAAQPQAVSRNVIEVVEEGGLEGITRQPNLVHMNRYVRPISIALGALLLIMVLPTFFGNNQKTKRGSEVSLAIDSANLTQEELAVRERRRIVQDQLSQARLLMKQDKRDEAKIKVDLVLEKLDPNNLEAKTLREEIRRVQALAEKQERAKKEQQQLRIRRLSRLMSEAGDAVDQKRYHEAKALYRQVLALSPNHTAAKENLLKIDRLVASEKKRTEELKAMQSKLEELFTKGMVAYNANHYAQAAVYLRQVAQFPKSHDYSQARIALEDIEEKLVVEIDEKLSQAKELYYSGHLVEARELLDEILSGSPKHAEAKDLRNKVVQDSRDKAQKLFREGYTFEKLVQDYSTAKERYRQVLELLPQSKEEYHRKARSRLNGLD